MAAAILFVCPACKNKTMKFHEASQMILCYSVEDVQEVYYGGRSEREAFVAYRSGPVCGAYCDLLDEIKSGVYTIEYVQKIIDKNTKFREMKVEESTFRCPACKLTRMVYDQKEEEYVCRGREECGATCVGHPVFLKNGSVPKADIQNWINQNTLASSKSWRTKKDK